MIVHDSLTDTRIPLPERTPGETSIYVCGPTVYGYIHVGNARPPVVFDVLVRHLRAGGRVVRYVHNFTDIDDKIIQIAVAHGEDPRAVAERYIQAYREDTAALRCVEPTATPRVSESLPAIIALIEALIARGHAYVTDDGDVYYDVASFAEYGKLSKRRVEVQRAEFGRGRTGEGKRHEHDFALWKSAKATEPPGARWPSPWSEGRPGWHIECSAMSHAHLGDHFDLHGGGQDLKFPHHENEIAQSEPIYGAPLAGAWMHNGFIEIDVARSADFTPEVAALLPTLEARDPNLMKVSKSDAIKLDALRARDPASLAPEERALAAVLERKVRFGHWFGLRPLMERIDPEAIRFWILGTHYRSPLAFDLVEGPGDAVSFPALEQAEKRVEYFYETRARLAARVASLPAPRDGAGGPGVAFFHDTLRAFSAALDDDLNIAGALDPMSRIYERANKLCDAKKPAPEELRAALAALDRVAAVTGVAEGDPEAFFARVTARRVAQRGIDPATIDALVTERVEARHRKDFARADALRAQLVAQGIELRDGPSGTTWRAV